MQRLSQSIALSYLLLAAMPALAQEASSAEQPAININSASAEQLETLPGIGTARAADIIADREAHGDYNSAEDLMRVNGIGEATVDGMRDRLSF
jgi:competence protein ComEA